ncbi:hypothetical protein AB1285_21530 [Microbacterium sp. NRRL B-14842]|uniref:hypothetical protein n=1 Tax=Microbacterium sp. NRRL B-14842 TaxID=3162881 RepID=UPI003D2BD204
MRPLKPQIVLAATLLVISTALQVAGPILISIGLDRALPAVLDDADWMPTFVVGGSIFSPALWPPCSLPGTSSSRPS